MTTSEFWAAQPFSYIATYSFNRGPKLLALHADAVAAIEQTKRELQQARFAQQPKLLQKLRELGDVLRGNISLKLLTEKELAASITAERIAVIERESMMARQLGDALQVPAGEEFASGCVPTYRDALAFYDEHDKLLCVLNICFQCLFMRTNDGLMVEASVGAYQALRQLLAQLGHPIEMAGEQA